MSQAMPHTAKAMVFTCMDERLEPAIRELIHALEGGAFHAALAGGGAAFTFESDQACAIKQVVAAFKINHITELYLQSHLECGAYGLAGVKFDSPTAEADRLYQDLETAKTLVTAALKTAGATDGEVTIRTEVIDLLGQHVEQPQLTTSR